MPRTMAALLHRGVPLLREDTPVGAGVGHVVESGFPALPVVDGDDCLVGIFGERDLPRLCQELGYAAFVPKLG
jgi:CBS domain-containing protein